MGAMAAVHYLRTNALAFSRRGVVHTRKGAKGALPEPNRRICTGFVPAKIEDRCAFGTVTRASAPLFATKGIQLRYGRPKSYGDVAARSLQQSVEPTVDASEYQTLVEEVKTRLEKEHADLPVGKNGRDDGALLLWFLRDRAFDVDATVTKLVEAIQWRKEVGVDEITEASISRMAATGKAYLHASSDKEGRPVLVVVAAKHFAVEEDLMESKKHCIYLIEKALSQLPPGAERILGIFDLRGFKQKNGDLKFVRFLIDVFFKYYPKRVGQCLFVDAPFIFQPGWNVVKPLLGKYAKLVRFVSAAELRDEYFTPETVPKDFKL